MTTTFSEQDIQSIVKEEFELAEKRIFDKINSTAPAPAPAKKIKSKKDPNAPKKPSTAFILFSSEQRPLIKDQNPGIPFAELAKKLGDSWKSADSKTKSKFIDLAEADKTRYKKQMESYSV